MFSSKFKTPDFLCGGGAVGACMRAIDWQAHALGATSTWPPGLQVAVRMMLASPFPMAILWGEKPIALRNDAMDSLLSSGHHSLSSTLGEPASAVFNLAWHAIEPVYQASFQQGLSATLDPVALCPPPPLGDPHPVSRMDMLPIELADGSARLGGMLASFSPSQLALAAQPPTDQAVLAALPPHQAAFAAPQAVNAIARTWAVSPDLLGVLSFDARFEAVNPAWWATLGWSRDEIIGRHILDLVHPDELHDAQTHWTDALAGRATQRLDTRFLCKDASWRWLSWVAISEDDKIYCSARDIDMQKTQGLALTQTLAERDMLWRSSQDIYVAIDGDKKISAINPAAKAILGWNTEEMIGKPALEFIYGDDMPIAMEALSRAAHAAIPPVEFRGIHKDGDFRWLSWAAAPEGNMIFAAGRHVTAQKEAEQALAITLADRDRIWHNSHDIIAVYNLAGAILDINPRASDILGWTSDEMQGHSMLDFIHPEDCSTIATGFISSQLCNRHHQFHNRFRHKNGSYRHISWSCGSEDGIIYAHGRDQTLELEQSSALRTAEENLRQSHKMEAVGQLTGGLAHDFNNLLAGICGNLELITMRMKQERYDDIARHVASAQGASKRAASLTHRLLAFSRRQTLDPTAVCVGKLIGGMAELIRRTVGPEIKLSFEGSDDLWATRVDANQLENACLNLCINARDAMPDGGTISIVASNTTLDTHAARDLDLPVGDYIHLRVIDDGLGMEQDVVAKAFEPFFTTKPLGMGTGLGLSMTYGFVRQSGGQIKITSKLGIGTTIEIFLPRHLGIAIENIDTSAPNPVDLARRGETILIVDDEPTIRFVIAETLLDAGYTILEAQDGASGLAILQSAARVDLLLTDVGLPGGMNGRQMADAARVSRSNLKVLFITGYAESAVMRGGDLDQGMAILTKPFLNENLSSKIRYMLDSFR
jgi:PAS domain S-box-containing protein